MSSSVLGPHTSATSPYLARPPPLTPRRCGRGPIQRARRSSAGHPLPRWPGENRPIAPAPPKAGTWASGPRARWIRPSTPPPLPSDGKVSRPVRSQFGFHLIEITSRKGNKAKGRHILFPIEVTGAIETSSTPRPTASRISGPIGPIPPRLDTVARALKLPIGRAEPVQQGSKVQLAHSWCRMPGCGRLKPSPRPPAPLSRPLTRIYIFRLDSLQPEGVPPLDRYPVLGGSVGREQKKWDAAREIAKAYVKRLEEGSSMAQAARHEPGPPGIRSLQPDQSSARPTPSSWVRPLACSQGSGAGSSTPRTGSMCWRVSPTQKPTPPSS